MNLLQLPQLFGKLSFSSIAEALSFSHGSLLLLGYVAYGQSINFYTRARRTIEAAGCRVAAK